MELGHSLGSVDRTRERMQREDLAVEYLEESLFSCADKEWRVTDRGKVVYILSHPSQGGCQSCPSDN